MPESQVADADVNPAEALLEVKNLRTTFFTADGAVHAVDNVSFNVRKGRPSRSSVSPGAVRA